MEIHMKFNKSEWLFEQSQKRIPGGVNSPVRAFGSVGRTPLFIDRGEGSHITDVDGNRFLDYVCSWGPGILGHAHPAVVQAVQEACQKGLTYGAPTEKEWRLADHYTVCGKGAAGQFWNRSGYERHSGGQRLYRAG